MFAVVFLSPDSYGTYLAFAVAGNHLAKITSWKRDSVLGLYG